MAERRVVHVPARESRALRLSAGRRFRVVDLEGGQVADTFAFCADDLSEHHSAEHHGPISRNFVLIVENEGPAFAGLLPMELAGTRTATLWVRCGRKALPPVSIIRRKLNYAGPGVCPFAVLRRHLPPAFDQNLTTLSLQALGPSVHPVAAIEGMLGELWRSSCRAGRWNYPTRTAEPYVAIG